MEVSKRHLPHISHPGDTYFITYRQKGTMPLVWEKQKAPVLTKPEIAELIINSWHDLSEKVKVHAYCIMPDHVHIVLTTKDGVELQEILESHKKYTARRINALQKWEGGFWQKESFDRILRHGKLEAAVMYTLMNPVKAGFVDHWKDWPHNYLSAELEWIVAPS